MAQISVLIIAKNAASITMPVISHNSTVNMKTIRKKARPLPVKFTDLVMCKVDGVTCPEHFKCTKLLVYVYWPDQEITHSIFLKIFAGFGLPASKKRHLYIVNMYHRRIVMASLFSPSRWALS